MRTVSDWELLEDYAKTRSEAAFAELVRRHIDWVHSAALRRVGNPQLAEDVVQTVFVLLAGKAAGLRPGTLPGGWLFRTTCFVAKCSLRAERRRKSREETASAMMTHAQPDDTELLWEQLAPCLDEAVAALSDADRSAIVLRFYQKMSLLEVGRQLGITEEAAKKRVSRTVEKLRASLSRRGVALGGALLAGFLAERTVEAAPESLAPSVLRTSSAAAAATLPQLARDVLNAWHWAKMKLASAVGVSVALLVLVLCNVHAPRLHAASGAISREARKAAAVQKPPSITNNALQSYAGTVSDRLGFLFRVVAADTGKGIAAARVPVSYFVNGERIRREDLVTDNQGLCAVPLPDGKLERLDVGAVKDGFVAKSYDWRAGEEDEETPPSVYVLRLERAVGIGGRVVDSQGKGVRDARIALVLPGGDVSSAEPAHEGLGFGIEPVAAALTDPQGNWNCALIPPGCGQFSVMVEHPDFVPERFRADPGSRKTDDSRFRAMEDLLGSKAAMVLEPGFELEGLVLEDSGNPLAGAKVSRIGDSNYEQGGVKTGADGRFRMTGLPQGRAQVSAWAKGFAPCLLDVQVSSNTRAPVFRLNRGVSFALRIIDEEGVAVPGAWATADLPVRHNGEFRATSDATGRIGFEGIPTNALGGLVFHAGAKGYFIRRHVTLPPGNPQPTIRLTKSLNVSGTVLDADTREPIAYFKSIPCRQDSSAGYDRIHTRHGHLGAYSIDFTEPQPPFRVRIEADGYEPAMSPPMGSHPSEQVLDFLLHKQDTNNVIQGIVLRADGGPAADTPVALLTFEQAVSLVDGEFVTNRGGGIIAATDAGGRFRFSHDPNAHTVVAADPADGFGLLRLHRSTQPYTVQMRPWGRIEGRLLLSGRPAPDRQLSIAPMLASHGFVNDGLNVAFHFATTDAEGRFSWALVPPGDLRVHVVEAKDQPVSHETAVQVRSGETTQLQIGGRGRTIIGRLAMEDGSEVDWPACLNFASIGTNLKRPAYEPPPRAIDFAGRIKLLDYYDDSTEWRAYARACGSFPLQVAADGSFIVEDVAPGSYQLHLRLADSPYTGKGLIQRVIRPAIASIEQDVSVPDEPGESAPVDLGTIQVHSNSKDSIPDSVFPARFLGN
jgi:RNA polymerase sigma factor (sigma-70 family)